MLVLSRKIGERIVIGDGIELVVQKISGERVVLGLVAPADVRIMRSELLAAEQSALKPVTNNTQTIPADAAAPCSTQLSDAGQSAMNKLDLFNNRINPVAVRYYHHVRHPLTATGVNNPSPRSKAKVSPPKPRG